MSVIHENLARLENDARMPQFIGNKKQGGRARTDRVINSSSHYRSLFRWIVSSARDLSPSFSQYSHVSRTILIAAPTRERNCGIVGIVPTKDKRLFMVIMGAEAAMRALPKQQMFNLIYRLLRAEIEEGNTNNVKLLGIKRLLQEKLELSDESN